MSLRERLNKIKDIDGEIEEMLINSVKQKIRSDENPIINQHLLRREDFKDKLYLMLIKEIEKNFPAIEPDIDDLLIERALSEIFGLGVLEKYLQDPKVTDIMIQDKEMIIIQGGVKRYLGEVFSDVNQVYLIIDRIKSYTGKTVDQRIPFLNTQLYDGSRCSVVIPPVSDRIYITIRVFNCLDLSIEDLLRLDMFDEKVCHCLKNIIRLKKNIIIAGAMGSGKTTLLNTLCKLIPKNEFINVIQDVPEIRLKEHPYVRMLTTRPKSREVDNEINQDRLVFETLRMKADRIIVGEVRDSMAAYQMLQALNTGHRGSISTIHADSAYDALIRLETLAMEFKPNIGHQLIKKLISRALDAVIFLGLEKDKDFNISSRKVSEVLFIEDSLDERGDYRLNRL
jgi:pilus assembly protein CpaF